jgi:hypothetical protein
MLLTLVLVGVAALALLIAVPAYGAFATHNRLVALDQRCDTAFGDIDVHLKHRHNLIPPLVETVRGFTKHESDNLAVEEYATTLRQFPGSTIGRRAKMNVRLPFDLGIERVLIDEPLAFKF